VIFAAAVLTATAGPAFAGDLLLRLAQPQFVDANGLDIGVPGYSVPSFVDWNSDGLKDLVTGEGPYPAARVRIYLNIGTQSNPQFDDFIYAQSEGADLTCPASGCLGCFPRVVYWDQDAKKDLLVGLADGKVKIFINVGSDQDPVFDAGTFLQYGQPGLKSDIDVEYRATPTVVDFNNDGIRDLVVGSRYGKIFLHLNQGTDAQSDYPARSFVKSGAQDIDVPGDRSSPVVMDLDGDGKKDILTGNTYGELLFYCNTGTDAEPDFLTYEYVWADGAKIDLAGSPRSRPFVTDWTADGYLDVLIGAADGKIHLYQSMPQRADLDKDFDVDFDDFALFALYYGFSDCGQCGGADLVEPNAAVDMADLLEFARYWLQSTN